MLRPGLSLGVIDPSPGPYLLSDSSSSELLSHLRTFHPLLAFSPRMVRPHHDTVNSTDVPRKVRLRHDTVTAEGHRRNSIDRGRSLELSRPRKGTELSTAEGHSHHNRNPLDRGRSSSISYSKSSASPARPARAGSSAYTTYTTR